MSKNYKKFKKGRYQPKKKVRTFQDLEIYHRALEAFELVAEIAVPLLEDANYFLKENLLEKTIKTSLKLPEKISKAHSARFDESPSGMDILNECMKDCNTMVVYLEEIFGLYSKNIERKNIDKLIRNYSQNRKKILHLYKAWERFQDKEKKKNG